jgi:formylglycine-generating enzyme
VTKPALPAVVALTCVVAACAGSLPAVPPSPTGPDMLGIPGGEFRMGDVAGNGDPDERPVHAVSLPSFRLARHEVTVAQFATFVTATGYATDAERNARGKDGCIALGPDPLKSGYEAGLSWRKPGFPQTERDPVVCVSWYDAREYVQWLRRESGRRFRLPTEAEWEFAARAGSDAAWIWGSDGNRGCEYANGADDTPGPGGAHWTQKMNCTDGHFYTAPVGSYRPNGFGLYDMIGNAWEWTEDCYQPDYSGASADGSAVISAECAKRAVRGGAWPYPPGWLRTANRGGSNPELRANDRGFRVAED